LIHSKQKTGGDEAGVVHESGVLCASHAELADEVLEMAVPRSQRRAHEHDNCKQHWPSDASESKYSHADLRGAA